ncbi:MAG TPA: hypothetical protein VNS58_16205 [Puia sp.]|nr:hypothetical protein [Puia sp.]
MNYSGLAPSPSVRIGRLMPVRLIFLLAASFISCGPSIHSFQVDQQTITAADSVKVNWEVSGKPTLLIHEAEERMELTLVAQKNGKEARQFIQVIVLPPGSVDTIIFPVGGAQGDTLLAAGEKNSTRWGDHFQLGSVASASGRPLLVTHGGKTVWLDGQNPDTVTFRGMANSGLWEIRSLMTDAEKTNPATAPAVLRLRTKLLYKKQ